MSIKVEKSENSQLRQGDEVWIAEGEHVKVFGL